MREVTRRLFLRRSAGVAGGAAIVGAPAVLAETASARGPDAARVLRRPSRGVPREPVIAYVRDARRGEVTIVAGRARPPTATTSSCAGCCAAAPGRLGGSRCPPTAKRPRSARTRSPTTPTPTRSSARTSPTRSRSSRTTSRSRTRPAARTSTSSATTSSTRSTSTTTATARPDVTYQFEFQDRAAQRGHVPLQHRADHRRSTARTGTSGSSTPSRRSPRTGDGRRDGTTTTTTTRPDAGRAPALAAVQHRPALDAGLPGAGRGRRARPAAAARRSSPGSATRASSSTWARSSTSATCGRSRTSTSSPTSPAMGVDATAKLNVHTIAIRVPISDLTRDGSTPNDPMSRKAVLGIWGAREPPQGAPDRPGQPGARRVGPVGPGLAARQPAVQRGRGAAGRQGPLERARPARRRRGLRQVRRAPRAREAAQRALPGRVPEPRGADEAAGRPRRDPADRAAGGDHPGLPELHGQDAGRHAAAQRRDPADVVARTRSGCSATTWPGSRTAAAWPTTS